MVVWLVRLLTGGMTERKKVSGILLKGGGKKIPGGV